MIAPGASFQPGLNDNGDEERRRRNAGVQEAIKVLSLRMPRVVGASAPAPSALLNAPGSGGNPQIDSVVNQILQRVMGSGGQAPTNAAPSVPMSAPSATRPSPTTPLSSMMRPSSPAVAPHAPPSAPQQGFRPPTPPPPSFTFPAPNPGDLDTPPPRDTTPSPGFESWAADWWARQQRQQPVDQMPGPIQMPDLF